MFSKTYFCLNICIETSRMRRMVGVLSDTDDQAIIKLRYPDCTYCAVLSYCPVWVGAAIPIWTLWSHMKEAPMYYAPFRVAGTMSTPDTFVTLKVKEFARVFDPMRLAQYLWAVPAIRRVDVLVSACSAPKVLTAPDPSVPVSWMYHVERIAAMVADTALHGPVHVVRRAPFPWVLRDGNHRFAAALVRADAVIDGVCDSAVAKELIYDGLAIGIGSSA